MAVPNLSVALANPSTAAQIEAILNNPGRTDSNETYTGNNTFSGTVALNGAITIGATVTVGAYNFVLDATTGTQFGTASSQKLGFFGATPVAQRTAYTQTAYATADKTVANITTSSPSTTLVLTATAIAAATPSLTLTDAVNTNAGTVATSLNQAQKDIGTAFNTLRTEVAALVVDLADVKQALNSVIDDLQALGLVG